MEMSWFRADHKRVGVQYLWAGLLFLAVGGALSMLMRWQWGFPGQPVPAIGTLLFPDTDGVITPAGYAGLFSAHGLIMIFFAITPLLLGGFGTYLVPLMIGANSMAFPRLNVFAFWLFVSAQVTALVSLVVPPAPPSAGWTMYAPLSTGESSPGAGMTLMVVAILVSGISTVVSAVNLIVTVLRKRAPGMKFSRLPLTVWGLWLTAILNALFVPVLGAAALLLLADRLFATQFFAAATGDPLLYQHLFWIFGHPEVYILILPIWGIIGDLLAWFSRKPAHGYRATVGAFIAVTVLSGFVYGHHMYQSGLGPLADMAFELFTLAISVPAVIIVCNWMLTLWRGSIQFSVPMLFALGTILVFGLGGLTALPLAATTSDIYFHDSMWVVGHFHLILAAATLMGSFAGIYFWFPKMFGRMMSRRLGLIHFAGTLVFALVTFGGQLASGYAGQLRRLADPTVLTFVENVAALNRHTTLGAFALGAFQLFFVWNFFASLRRGRPAGANPWGASTLEWTLSSPPPALNFEDGVTVTNGPYDFDASGEFVAQDGGSNG